MDTISDEGKSVMSFRPKLQQQNPQPVATQATDGIPPHRTLTEVLAATPATPLKVSFKVEVAGVLKTLELSIVETSPSTISIKEIIGLEIDMQNKRSHLFPGYMFHYRPVKDKYEIWVSKDLSNIRATPAPEQRIICYDNQTHIMAEYVENGCILRKLYVLKDPYDTKHKITVKEGGFKYVVIDAERNSTTYYTLAHAGRIVLDRSPERTLYTRMRNAITQKYAVHIDVLRLLGDL